jgi:hypothetical protein
MQTRSGFLICWTILMNYYGVTVRIIVNYRSLHRCSPSSRIVGCVRLIIIELLNGREAFYLKRTGWKKTSILLKSMMKPLNSLTCALMSAWYTTLNMLSWPSAWHVGIPVTKPDLILERLSWHIKNLNTSKSHLDCRGYSCHQGLLSAWHDTSHMMRLMEWWCILITTKHGNTLTVCIFTF